MFPVYFPSCFCCLTSFSLFPPGASSRDLLVFLDLKVLLDNVVLLVCLDKEEREVSLACPDLL